MSRITRREALAAAGAAAIGSTMTGTAGAQDQGRSSRRAV